METKVDKGRSLGIRRSQTIDPYSTNPSKSTLLTRNSSTADLKKEVQVSGSEKDPLSNVNNKHIPLLHRSTSLNAVSSFEGFKRSHSLAEGMNLAKSPLEETPQQTDEHVSAQKESEPSRNENEQYISNESNQGFITSPYPSHMADMVNDVVRTPQPSFVYFAATPTPGAAMSPVFRASGHYAPPTPALSMQLPAAVGHNSFKLPAPGSGLNATTPKDLELNEQLSGMTLRNGGKRSTLTQGQLQQEPQMFNGYSTGYNSVLGSTGFNGINGLSMSPLSPMLGPMSPMHAPMSAQQFQLPSMNLQQHTFNPSAQSFLGGNFNNAPNNLSFNRPIQHNLHQNNYARQQHMQQSQWSQPNNYYAQQQHLQNQMPVLKTHGEQLLERLRLKLRNSPAAGGLSNLANPQGHRQNSTALGSLALRELNSSLDFGLAEIQGAGFLFSKDQFGSRFIQFQLEDPQVPQSVKDAFFEEISGALVSLCKDVFGNYVVQKLLEINVGTREQHNKIVSLDIKGNMYELSTHMYGCRVVQKLVESIFGFTSQQNPSEQINPSVDMDNVYSIEAQDELLRELQVDVQALVRDQNANHVVQKCLERVRPASRIQFLLEVFRGKYMALSKHPYGCRVVQRVLENSSSSTISCVVSELMLDLHSMVTDQYANYVIQHVIKHQRRSNDEDESSNEYRRSLFKVVGMNVLMFSQHKFGSNVVECCLVNGTIQEKKMLIDKILENNTLIMMMKDPYANYVVQKVIEKSNSAQREKVVMVVQKNEAALRRLTYGKHIINKLKAQEQQHFQ